MEDEQRTTYYARAVLELEDVTADQAAWVWGAMEASAGMVEVQVGGFAADIVEVEAAGTIRPEL